MWFSNQQQWCADTSNKKIRVPEFEEKNWHWFNQNSHYDCTISSKSSFFLPLNARGLKQEGIGTNFSSSGSCSRMAVWLSHVNKIDDILCRTSLGLVRCTIMLVDRLVTYLRFQMGSPENRVKIPGLGVDSQNCQKQDTFLCMALWQEEADIRLTCASARSTAHLQNLV